MTLPTRYEGLVSRFKPEEEKFSPKDTTEIWNGLIYPFFLGPRTKSAQTVYVSDVLYDWVEYSVAVRSLTDSSWSKKMLDDIKSELKSIRGSPGEGHKRVILSATSTTVRKGELVRTIADAYGFFSKKKIDPTSMKKMENDKAQQSKFIAEAVDSIYGFGIVKSVFWLYGMGIGHQLVPTNLHVRKFLRSCGYKETAFLNDTPDLYTFAPACKRMQEVASNVSTSLGRTVTPKVCQHSAWLFYACKGLLSRSKAGLLTFKTLLDYLDSRSWTPETLDDVLGNIERVDDLADDLAAFL